MTGMGVQRYGNSRVSSYSILQRRFSTNNLSITTNLDYGVRVCYFNNISLRARIESLKIFYSTAIEAKLEGASI